MSDSSFSFKHSSMWCFILRSFWSKEYTMQIFVYIIWLHHRDSQILPNSCRCRWYQCRWCNWAQVGAWWRSCSLCCFVSCWLVVEPSWDDRGSSISGCFCLFVSILANSFYCSWYNGIFMYCLEWRLYANSLSLSYSVHGVCKDYPSCGMPTMRLCL